MKTKAERIAGLSKRGRALYDRVCAGQWYAMHDEKTPQAMAELVAARLVKTIVRAQIMTCCYAPTGARSMKIDTYPTA